ncbi:pyridoxamine 5'-phosphate oxidase family protein [Iamia majanohamensis]|uniref:Pyridoxamine 5'-phosphate oxidase family protein n=1 Tax=Iamia majanohamensis TaxID=467976 RepID=A0AAF0BSK8_9ACTN|nr:pyridoxamine 5'-phosphate oxidase family protein [Iamia majanohamensis]WCO68481.1 pyridoxamine 5'-phosphate oxidase family protein [Iamia majanohamensis]
MSRRELIKMTDEETDAFLADRHTMNLATHNHDGTIHLVAMWYGILDDGTIGFETFERSQKVQNLRRDARVTALVEDGDSYDQLRGAELVGTMELTDDQDTLMAIALSVIGRYQPEIAEADRWAVAEMMVRKRIAMLLRPEKRVTWDHRKLEGGY